MAQSLQGISALDPRVAATDKFIQEKQIPPDQVEDFLLGMGADPRLASLVFKYRKVKEAAEKQQNEKPSTSNVADEVSNQYAQLKQQERMRQGVAGMPTPNLARAAMRGGITGEPAPQAQMAGGGIVAFDDGGSIPRNRSLVPYKAPFYKRAAGAALGLARRHPLGLAASLLGLGALVGGDEEEAQQAQEASVEQIPEGLSAEDYRTLASMNMGQDQTGAGAARPLSAPPKSAAIDLSPLEKRLAEAKARLPKDEQAAIDAELAREKPYLESLAARRSKIEEQEKKGTTSAEKKFWLAFAQAGFAASAKGARNLWETLSIGGAEGMKAYEAIKDKEQQLLERLQDKKLQLDDLEAQVKRGATKSGIDRLDKLRSEVTSAQSELTKTQVAVGLADRTEAGANYRARLAQEGADRRASTASKALRLDQAIDNAILKSTDPNLTEQQRQAAAKLAKELIAQRARKEATESGAQSQAARLSMQRELLGLGGEGDGFGGLAVE
jgi:hypothetical protein